MVSVCSRLYLCDLLFKIKIQFDIVLLMPVAMQKEHTNVPLLHTSALSARLVPQAMPLTTGVSAIEPITEKPRRQYLPLHR
jgi:hypothetical protein